MNHLGGANGPGCPGGKASSGRSPASPRFLCAEVPSAFHRYLAMESQMPSQAIWTPLLCWLERTGEALSADEQIPSCNYAVALFQIKVSALAGSADVPSCAKGGRLFSEQPEKNSFPDPIYCHISGRFISNLHCKLKTHKQRPASSEIAIRTGAHLAKEFELTLKPV